MINRFVTLRTVILVILIAPVFSLAQELDFVADIVQFKGDAQRTRWEFQYAFADTSVHYVAHPDGFVGELYCKLILISRQRDTILDEWIATSKTSSSRIEHHYYLTGVRQLLVHPGKYNVQFLVYDLNDSLKRKEQSFESTVHMFGLQTDISEVMFTQPQGEVVDTNFIRNSQQAVPNPRHEVSGTDPSLSVYFEIYNAKINNLDSFAIEFQILDNVRTEEATSYIRQVGTHNALVIREDLPVGILRSNVYYLKISIKSLDLATTYASEEDRFYVLNPTLPPVGQAYQSEEEQFMASEWSIISGDRLKLELELSDIIATQAEKETHAACQDDRCLQRYLFAFWKVRDFDQSTSANERLDEFRAMYRYAQKFYTSASVREGWKTDRGRTLIKYGKPTQVEQFIQTIDTKPYEVWFYQNLQGGVNFYFVDWQLLQNHKLVHSTMIGGIRNENWFNQYAKAYSPNPISDETLTNPKK